jgi:formylglycine-generating enzyme required for sulfatase activity
MKKEILAVFSIMFIIFLTGCNKHVPMEMITVDKGSFMMGSDSASPNEKPLHKVNITRPFLIGKYEVTFEQYDAFCKDTRHKAAMDYGFGREKHPVIGVKWTDALEFCNWMSKKESLKECYTQTGNNSESWICDFSTNGYRLPTEAEWEFAARGGNKSMNYKYSGSNNNEEVAWYNDNSKGTTQIVGQKKPNELDIYDMSGNVFEWCWDWFNGSFYSVSPEDNPVCSFDTPGRQKVFHIGRGGSYNSGILSAQPTSRSYDAFDPQRKPEYGFRVVRNAE